MEGFGTQFGVTHLFDSWAHMKALPHCVHLSSTGGLAIATILMLFLPDFLMGAVVSSMMLSIMFPKINKKKHFRKSLQKLYEYSIKNILVILINFHDFGIQNFTKNQKILCTRSQKSDY